MLLKQSFIAIHLGFSFCDDFERLESMEKVMSKLFQGNGTRKVNLFHLFI